MEENRKMAEQEIEDAVKYVTVSFAVEGLNVTEEEKENMRKVGRGGTYGRRGLQYVSERIQLPPGEQRGINGNGELGRRPQVLLPAQQCS